MAKEFIAMIEKHKPIIKDPIAAGFISEIGNRIVEQLPPQPFEFSFSIVNEDHFNAFASPGSNIFINRGLVTSLDNVNELAGILAHETGHAVCRHVSQMIDKSKMVNIGTLAGMLAGVLMGASGAGDIAQGVVISSAAAGQSTMLAFSRENETEADQKGLVYAANASFSPWGLLTGLEKIRANDFYGTDSIPGYLKTHPGTKERIVYIQAWIEDHYKEKDLDNGIDPFRFEMIKYRLAGIYGEKDETEQKLGHLLEKKSDNPAVHYGMALVLTRKLRFEEALAHLNLALAMKHLDPLMLFEIGRVYYMQGEYNKALNIFKGLENIEKVKPLVCYYRGSARLELGMMQPAREDFLKVIDDSIPFFPRAYYNMARISGVNGEKGNSHYYLGLYYNEIHDRRNTCFHLNQSIKTLSDPQKKERARTLLKKCGKGGSSNKRSKQ
ncbi:MAG: M48 family metalloprotease [Thermodesulfobacteriota bacterium]|nr:M48 family metalloprotease [Thermodesulfobacteriota bacterium]